MRRTSWDFLLALAGGLAAIGCDDTHTAGRSAGKLPEPAASASGGHARPSDSLSSSLATLPENESAKEFESNEPDPLPAQTDPPALKDRRALIAEIVEHLESAKYKTQTGDRDGVQEEYRHAGRLAAELQQRYPELTRQERRICSIVSYYRARTLAGETPEAAMAAISHAVELGFDDLERLDTDSELAPLRQVPDYAESRRKWAARAAQIARAEIRKKLAAFEPYAVDFRLPNLESRDVRLADFRGKVVVLAFWGTWCVQCEAEIPTLVKLQEEYGPRGVQVIGLTYEEIDDPQAIVPQVREFLKTHPVNYPCLIGDDAVRDQVRPADDSPPEWVFPTTLVLDQSGQVRLHFTGSVSFGKLEAAVSELLKDGSAEN